MAEQGRDKQEVKAEPESHPWKTVSVLSVQWGWHLDTDLPCNLIPERRALLDLQKEKERLAWGRVITFLPYRGEQEHTYLSHSQVCNEMVLLAGDVSFATEFSQTVLF